ncbi:hypothetical protein GQ55_1G371600 [Panicum hallii var. hallii]|jgi:hypothetical protein|uniref:Uncharacterized protein n=2 Tax=Panicum hallii TaxID=206008 RepID=A0A2T7FBI7_9POAL|nr:hypothetical protein GQ55_1G371600 [Panicum hallii var. hallii]PVH66901.1 hypothetical protein PAHAL_1G379100 [Panicum hallii]
MECKLEDGSPSWFSPAALASWLARFCSGSIGGGDDHDDEPAAGGNDDRPMAQMAAAAAKYLTYSPHKIKLA